MMIYIKTFKSYSFIMFFNYRIFYRFVFPVFSRRSISSLPYIASANICDFIIKNISIYSEDIFGNSEPARNFNFKTRTKLDDPLFFVKVKGRFEFS